MQQPADEEEKKAIAASPDSEAVKEACFEEDYVRKYDGDNTPLEKIIGARAFWHGYKGYVKGMVGGLFVGSGIGGTIGLAGAGIAAVVGSVAGFAVTGPLALGCLAIGAAYGMLKGAEEFAHIGVASSSATAAVIEAGKQTERSVKAMLRNQARINARLHGKEEELASIAPEMYEPVENISNPNAKPGDGPHMAAATAPTSKLFHWKTALIGLAIGAGVGMLLATGIGALAGAGYFAGLAASGLAPGLLHGLAAGHVAAEILPLTATITGLFGATFGIDRSIFRRTFDFTDHLFSGEIFRKPRPEIPGHNRSAHVTIKTPDGKTLHTVEPTFTNNLASAAAAPQPNVTRSAASSETAHETANIDAGAAESPVKGGHVDRLGAKRRFLGPVEKGEDYHRNLAQQRAALASLDPSTMSMQ